MSPDQRSTVVGMANCVNTIFGGAGALLVGKYRASLGFQTVFSLVPILIVLSVTALVVVYFKFLARDLARHRAVQDAGMATPTTA